MTFKEFVKINFAPTMELPGWVDHNSFYDAVLLSDKMNMVPDVIRSPDGRSYVYFERMTPDVMAFARAMGFKPRLHRSRRYFPPRHIYRAPVSRAMSKSAKQTVDKISTLSSQDVKECKMTPEYTKYISYYRQKNR